MKWTRDTTGRFRERPYYSPDELEQICERAVSGFLQQRYGQVEFPIRTEDLTVMIEQAVDDFDSFSDLPENIDGQTDFYVRKRPRVKIASRLQQPHLENRLRTTLTHEYGHVVLHGFLFGLDDGLQKMFDGTPRDVRNSCRRDHINGGSSDWMEWQAGFACSALLIPRSELTRVVKDFRMVENLQYAEIGVNSDAGQRLIQRVMAGFRVSRDAARVRLEQRKILVEAASPGLFG